MFAFARTLRDGHLKVASVYAVAPLPGIAWRLLWTVLGMI